MGLIKAIFGSYSDRELKKIIPIAKPSKKLNNLTSCNLCNLATTDDVIIEIDPIILLSITTTSNANHKIRPKNFNG